MTQSTAGRPLLFQLPNGDWLDPALVVGVTARPAREKEYWEGERAPAHSPACVEVKLLPSGYHHCEMETDEAAREWRDKIADAANESRKAGFAVQMEDFILPSGVFDE